MMEDLHTEFKRDWDSSKYLRNVAALANTDGGVIYVGLSDDGTVYGVKDLTKLLKQIPDDIQNILGIVPIVDHHSKDGKEYISITVSKSEDVVFCNGKLFVKSGSTTRELKGADGRIYLMKKYDFSWTDDPCNSVTVEDLDNVYFEDFKKEGFAHEKITSGELALDIKSLFKKLDILVDGHPKLGAVLLFHPEPLMFNSGACVKIGKFEGSEILYQDMVTGPLFLMPDKVVDLLMTKYSISPITYEGIRRIETPSYPYEALREAVLNSIIHNDYGTRTPIQIKVYPDRMEISDDGSPPSNWTLEKLLTAHKSHPGNPSMATVFYRAGKVESFGRGIQKILDQYTGRDVKAPEFKFNSCEFTVILYNENYVEGTATQTSVDDWKDNLSKAKLSDNELAVYELIVRSEFTSARDVASKLDISYASVNRVISSLVDKEMIKRIGSKKSGRWIVRK